jgi:hypothetical protein
VACRTLRQERQIADVQCRRDLDLHDDESAIRNGASPDDCLCGKPAAAHGAGLGCARFQHHLPPPKDACRQHSISWREGPVAPAYPSRGLQANHCRAVDSAGIKVEGKGEWNARKHGGPRRRVWRKIHIGIDENTLEIRAVEITSSNTGDAPMLELLSLVAWLPAQLISSTVFTMQDAIGAALI